MGLGFRGFCLGCKDYGVRSGTSGGLGLIIVP